MSGRRKPQDVVRWRANSRPVLRCHLPFFCILQNPSQFCAIFKEIGGATPVFVIRKESSATSVRLPRILCPLDRTDRNSQAQPTSSTVQVPPNLRSFSDQLLEKPRATSGDYCVTSEQASRKLRTISDESHRKSPPAFTDFRDVSAHSRAIPGGTFRGIFVLPRAFPRNFPLRSRLPSVTMPASVCHESPSRPIIA